MVSVDPQSCPEMVLVEARKDSSVWAQATAIVALAQATADPRPIIAKRDARRILGNVLLGALLSWCGIRSLEVSKIFGKCLTCTDLLPRQIT